MWNVKAVEAIRTMAVEKLPDAVKERRFANRPCLAAFLERCQTEAFQAPKRAVDLCLEAPNYVDRVLEHDTQEHGSRLVWALGILASCFSESGSHRLAEQTFRSGREIDTAEPLELSALEARYAYHRAQVDWREGLSRIDTVVEQFRTDDGVVREDRSLPTSLVFRGIIKGYGYYLGDASDTDSACRDFREAAELAGKALPRCQMLAVNGITTTAVIMWFTGTPVRFADPSSVMSDLKAIRRDLREQNIPIESPVDARCRWLMGLAGYRTAGGLARRPNRFMTTAREDLIKVGNPREVVELTLDRQWCLLDEGRLEEASAEFGYIADRLDHVPDQWQYSLDLWKHALDRHRIEEEGVRELYWTVRGLRNVRIPGPYGVAGDLDTPIGF